MGRKRKSPPPPPPYNYVHPCPSGKTEFKTKAEALLCILHWEDKPADAGPRPIRAYSCPLCGSFHLTSQEPKGKNGPEHSYNSRQAR
jgi:hypothetical protein